MEIIGKVSLVGPERTFPTKGENGVEEMLKAQDFKIMSGKNVFIATAMGKTLYDIKEVFVNGNCLYRAELAFSVRERETQNHEKFYVQNVVIASLEKLIELNY